MATISKSTARVRIVGAHCWLLASLPYLALMVQVDEAAALSSTSEFDGWIPNTSASNNSTLAWPLVPSPQQWNTSNLVATKSKSQFGGTFHDSHSDGDPTFNLKAKHYKTIAISVDSTGASTTVAPQHFHTTLKPGPISSASNLASTTPFDLATFSQIHAHQQHSHASSARNRGYHYPVPQYLPPLLSSQYLPVPPIHNIEIASEHPRPEHYYYQHQHPHIPASENSANNHLETNTENRLFIQPGKCSNSIEVGRTRDIEVRTALKSDTRNGVCMLMLYTPNQLNKLAISLQAVQGTTNVIPAGTWLETNVKVYALRAGDIQPIYTKSNFGANSPALILTRSNNVILSFYVDRPVDFFLDISTYQSLLC